MGFEPTDGCPSPVFKTGAFDHSATRPRSFYRNDLQRGRESASPGARRRHGSRSADATTTQVAVRQIGPTPNELGGTAGEPGHASPSRGRTPCSIRDSGPVGLAARNTLCADERGRLVHTTRMQRRDESPRRRPRRRCSHSHEVFFGAPNTSMRGVGSPQGKVAQARRGTRRASARDSLEKLRDRTLAIRLHLWQADRPAHHLGNRVPPLPLQLCPVHDAP